MADAHPGRTAQGWDAACLALVLVLTALPTLSRLGFYSDDWGLIGGFHLAEAAGGSHWDGLLDKFAARPVQGLYLASLYSAFGLQPLGYHLVNSAVLATSVPLFYLLLVRLGVGRTHAFAAGIILIVLPQLSTVRVWIAASQIPLAMLFMLASLHAQLRFARTRKVGWAFLALAAALVSLAAYETFAPLIGGFAIGLAVERGRQRGSGGRSRIIALTAAIVVFALALALLFKLAVSDRAGPVADPQRYVQGLRQLVRPDYDWRVDSSLNIYAALLVHFWMTLTGWAEAAAGLVAGRYGPLVAGVAAAAGAITWWRVRPRRGESPGIGPAKLFLLGGAAFLLGHATFLVVPSILFSPTGIANRALAAAAAGVALIFVSAAAFAESALPPRLRGTAFAMLVSIVAMAGTVRVAHILSYWAEAPKRQNAVLELAKTDLRELPAGSTVILDGVCPYHGPAVVFETWWDVGPALSLALARPVDGDVVSPRTRAAPSGLETRIYEQPRHYAYGDRLYAYNPGLRLVVPLRSFAAARAYFARPERSRVQCPAGHVGHGVPI